MVIPPSSLLTRLQAYTPPPSSLPPPNPVLRLSLPPINGTTGDKAWPMNYTPLNPVNFILRAALIKPKQWAVVNADKGWGVTYDVWAQRVQNLAYALLSIGLRPGDRVAVISPNAPLIADAHYGVLAAKGVITPLNIRNSPAEIAYILSHSGARFVLCDSEFAHLLPSTTAAGSAFRDLQIIISNDSGGRDPTDDYERFLDAGRKFSRGRGWEGLESVRDETDPCALCYTSGTTGRPKGVITTFRGSYLAAVANAFEAGITSTSVYLWVLPLFHACGWTFPWAVTAALGTHMTARKVDYDQLWKLFLEGGVTHYCGAPTVQIGIVNHPLARRLPNPVFVTIAASAPTAHLLGKLEALNLIPVHVYGLTETYGPITRRYSEPEWASLSLDERARLQARQGHGFLTADEVRVVKPSDDPDAPLVDVKRDGKELGEIVMRGNIVMKEYYCDNKATRKASRCGWFRSGDLAVRHPGGEIHILDRGKDIIISGGENISSLAVEAELARHPSVLECSVVARRHPKWGEKPHAFIVLHQSHKDKCIARPDEYAAEIKAFVRKSMSGFAVPEWVQIVDELPKTSTGKLQKNVLRERVSKL